MSGQSRNYLFISSLHEFSQFNVVSMRAHEKGILLFALAWKKNIRESDLNQQPANRDAVEYRRAKNTGMLKGEQNAEPDQTKYDRPEHRTAHS